MMHEFEKKKWPWETPLLTELVTQTPTVEEGLSLFQVSNTLTHPAHKVRSYSHFTKIQPL